MDDQKYGVQPYDPSKFASVPAPVQATKIQAQYTAKTVPQQAMMSYAKPIEDESDIYKGISKKEEAQIMQYTKGEPSKVMDIYSSLLQNKQDKAFLEDRKKMLAQAQMAALQSDDDDKRHSTAMIKVATYADYIREKAMKEGVLGVSKKSDDEIMFKAMTTSVLGEQGARDAFSRYMKGEIGADEVDSLIRTGNGIDKSQDMPEGSIAGDVVGGIGKSATGLTELGTKMGAWLGRQYLSKVKGYTPEQIAQIEDKISQDSVFSAKFGEHVDKFLQKQGVNTDSTSFKVGKTIGDIAQVATPTGEAALAGKIASGINTTTKLGKVAAGVAKLGVEGALATQKASLVSDKELASVGETVAGGALNVGIGALGEAASRGLKAAGNKLQLAGLINPQKLEYVQKALKEGGDEVDNVTEWMNQRNLVGSKKEIISKLQDEGKKTYTAVREAVKQSDDIVAPIQDQSIGGALQELIDTTSGVKSPQKRQVYDKLVSLMQKHDTIGLKPSEVQVVKDSMDELLNVYTIAGDVKSGVQKADLANLRSNIRGILEDTVSKSTGIDIGMLNRDTAVAYKLAEGIMKKNNAENIREIVSPFAPSAIGGVYGGMQGNTPEEKIMYAIAGVVAGGVSSNTFIKTNVGKALKSASKIKTKIPNAISSIGASQIANQDNKR